jgi:hypothetical protein
MHSHLEVCPGGGVLLLLPRWWGRLGSGRKPGSVLPWEGGDQDRIRDSLYLAISACHEGNAALGFGTPSLFPASPQIQAVAWVCQMFSAGAPRLCRDGRSGGDSTAGDPHFQG